MPEPERPDVVISEATPRDLPAARALLLSYLEYDPRWHADIDDLRGAYLENPRQVLLVAREPAGGTVVGTAAIRDRMPPAGWAARTFRSGVSCELGRVAVHEAWRRRGLALRLTEAARRRAVDLGYEAVHLHTDAANAPARALWAAVATELAHERPPDAQTIYYQLPLTLEVQKRARARPGGYQVRLARESDLDAARALMIRTFKEDYGYGLRPEMHADVLALREHYLDHPRQALAVAVDEADGRVIAVGAVQEGGAFPQPRPDWLPARFPRTTTAELVRVYTHREERRRGASRDIVELLRRWVAAEGSYEHLVLHTNTGRDGAEPFWRSIATELYDARPTKFNTLHLEVPLHRAVPGSHNDRLDLSPMQRSDGSACDTG